MKILLQHSGFLDKARELNRCVRQATELLHQGMVAGGSGVDPAMEQIRDLEPKGDAVVRAAMAEYDKRLTSTYPAMREDVHRAFSRVDDILDLLEGLAGRIMAFQLVEFPDSSIALARLLVKCSEQLEQLTLAASEGQRITDHVIGMYESEHRADQLYHEGITVLFETEADPIRLLKLKDVYDLLERSADSFKVAAQTLQDITIKNLENL